jgi:hypothetical protein
MAGSLNHIVGDDGRFTMDCIDNLGDAHEALEECYAIIYALTGGHRSTVNYICNRLGFPSISADMVAPPSRLPPSEST